MNHYFSRSLIALTVFMLFFLFTASCPADVLFVHDYRSNDYLLGTQDAVLHTGYTPQAMVIDKKIRYTGEMMKTIFGKVEEGRETAHFLLDKDQIREIDYYKGKIIVFPLKRLSDISWIKRHAKHDELAAEVIKERYRVLEPRLTITVLPGKETIRGYVCRRVEADLRLETLDVKKKSSSVTLVKQKLWVSTNVPGYHEYTAFHQKLAKRLGLDAARLGNLGGVLMLWEGSLDPIRKSLKEIKGYPVKSITTVDGYYTAGTDTSSPKTSSMKLKEELVELKNVFTEKLDEAWLAVPSDFGVTVVE